LNKVHFITNLQRLSSQNKTIALSNNNPFVGYISYHKWALRLPQFLLLTWNKAINNFSSPKILLSIFMYFSFLLSKDICVSFFWVHLGDTMAMTSCLLGMHEHIFWNVWEYFLCSNEIFKMKSFFHRDPTTVLFNYSSLFELVDNMCVLLLKWVLNALKVMSVNKSTL